MFLSNQVLSAYFLVGILTDYYYARCSTLKECLNILRSNRIFLNPRYIKPLKEMTPEDFQKGMWVIVFFSSEEDYTVQEVRCVRIQKEYLKKKVLKAFKEYDNEIMKKEI